jgi:hypothetical protein
MRLWTVHPKYLDGPGLVALWREALLARAVLRGATRGYRHHPQLTRFRVQPDAVACLNTYLAAVHAEATGRGYRFDRTKLGGDLAQRRLAESAGQLAYEWNHLRHKLRGRSPNWERGIRRIRKPDPHPLFVIVPGSIAPWERMASRGAA